MPVFLCTIGAMSPVTIAIGILYVIVGLVLAFYLVCLAFMAVVWAGVRWHAWRHGNAVADKTTEL